MRVRAEVAEVEVRGGSEGEGEAMSGAASGVALLGGWGGAEAAGGRSWGKDGVVRRYHRGAVGGHDLTRAALAAGIIVWRQAVR